MRTALPQRPAQPLNICQSGGLRSGQQARCPIGIDDAPIGPEHEQGNSNRVHQGFKPVNCPVLVDHSGRRRLRCNPYMSMRLSVGIEKEDYARRRRNGCRSIVAIDINQLSAGNKGTGCQKRHTRGSEKCRHRAWIRGHASRYADTELRG